MQWYVDVIVPLPLAGSFTYRLGAVYEPMVQTGSRVVVQFGAKRFYTAIVLRKHNECPQGDYEIKEIVEVLDASPIVQPMQLKLWQWIADYYMCSIGDVYKAAVPSGLKVESETMVTLNAEYVADSPLAKREQQMMDALSANPKQSVQQLFRSCGMKQGMQVVKSLLDKGALYIDEAIRQSYRPKHEVYVCLCESYRSEAAFNEVYLSLRRAAKQQQMLLKLVELAGCEPSCSVCSGMVLRSVLLKACGMTAAVLNALIEKGIVEFRTVEVGRLASGAPAGDLSLSPLSPHQQCAFDGINLAWHHHDACLLHGVTASGKTEVYIHLISEQLRMGRQVLYLVPEIALTQQMADRLRRAFGSRLGVYHSKFSDTERVEIWKKQLGDNPYDVILGVRSSVFLPFKDLGLVIVDEEHEPTYKQQEPAPRYHARSVAMMLASYHKTKTLLGTATPSVETYSHACNGKYGLVEMTERFGQVQLPGIEVVDLADEYRRKRMYGPFSTSLYEAMHQALDEGCQVILFQNRRGYALMLECSSCGWVPRCDRCDVSLTYHRSTNRLVCHYCGNVYNLPAKCPSCGAQALAKHGMGTERIEEEVARYFPKARVVRMDLDTTRSKSAYEKILTDFQEGRTNVLIGTQMISKGLDFDNVHVVGIVNADTMLNLPDFRSHERSFQLMAQVAGRAGRRGRQGLVLLQTRNVGTPVIRQVMDNDYPALYADQMAERELFCYPPFCRLIYLYIKGRNEVAVERAADALAHSLRQSFANSVLGPEVPVVARVQSLHIRKIMLKVQPTWGVTPVRQCLRSIEHELTAQNLLHGIALYYDVDPM